MQPLNVYSLISTVINVVCAFTKENSGPDSCVVNIRKVSFLYNVYVFLTVFLPISKTVELGFNLT